MRAARCCVAREAASVCFFTEDALGGVAQIWLEGQDFTVELLSVVLEWGHVLA